MVRNFFIDADIDGRVSQLTGGPRGKNGEFKCTFYIRENGEVSTARLVVTGQCKNGDLHLEASIIEEDGPDSAGVKVTQSIGFVTERD